EPPEREAVLRVYPLRIERAVEGVGLPAAGAARVHGVDLVGAVPVRREEDAAVRARGPAGLVVAPVAVGEVGDRARGEVEGEEIAAALRPERRAVGREHHGPPIGAYRGIQVLVPVGGEALEPAVAEPEA